MPGLDIRDRDETRSPWETGRRKGGRHRRGGSGEIDDEISEMDLPRAKEIVNRTREGLMTQNYIAGIGRDDAIPPLGHLLNLRLDRCVDVYPGRFRREKAEQFRIQPIDDIDRSGRLIGQRHQQGLDRLFRRHGRGL